VGFGDYGILIVVDGGLNSKELEDMHRLDRLPLSVYA